MRSSIDSEALAWAAQRARLRPLNIGSQRSDTERTNRETWT
jgi:hypothetical protein